MNQQDIDRLRANAKDKGACYGQYERLMEAGYDTDAVMRVVMDNACWVLRHLAYGPWRTPEVCMAAVQQNGYAVQYLTDAQRTPEVCLAAVQQDGYAVEHLTDAQRQYVIA